MASPSIPVLLSTSSVFPEPTSSAFDTAASLGYDGLEVMIWTDPVSQDVAALKVLSEHYGVRVGFRHARKHLGWALNVAASAAGVSVDVLTRWRQTVLTAEQPSVVKISRGEAYEDFAWRAAA